MADNETTPIDFLFREQMELAEMLNGLGEISFAQTVQVYLSKTLLLASASLFESRITEAISSYVVRVSNADEALHCLVRNKAIERQYHTYFDWKGRSVNPFLGLFGETFRDTAKLDLKDAQLAPAAKDFLELGELRNQLVHGNYGTYLLEKTADEIYALYKSGLRFVLYVEHKLDPHETKTRSPVEG